MSSAVPVLSIANLEVSIASVRILRGVSLELPAGSMTGLIGRNGAGKTTLMKTIMGILKRSNGAIAFESRELLDVPTYARVRLGIGYMPEAESFIPGTSAVDTVYLAARLSGLPHVDALQRSHRVLGYVGLREERYRDVAGYSMGMKQKVKLAQAVVHHPKLLLLDEPTAGLDPLAREEMLALVKQEVARAGCDQILTSGIVLTGGGAVLDQMPELAERVFRLPVRLGVPLHLNGLVDVVASPMYSTAVGLVLHGLKQHGEAGARHGEGVLGQLGAVRERMMGWLREFF